MKKILAVILALVAFNLSCGALNKKDDELLCNMANSTYRQTQEVALNYADAGTPYTDIAQSFTPSKSMSSSYVDLVLFSTGTPNPASTLTVAIQKDANGVPDNINLSSGFVQVSQVVAQPNTIRFALATKVSLAADTKYWIRLSSNLASSTTNLVKWAGAFDVYSSGEAKYLGQVTWDNTAIANAFTGGVSQDLVFSLDCK